MKFPRYREYKDSGVEWLGEVPAHWGTPTLNSRYSVELGKMLDESRIVGTDLVPYLRNVDVQWDAINFEDLPSMDIREGERARYTVEKGDLLVCEGGESGRAAIVAGTPGVVGFQKALHRLRARGPCEVPRFMFYTLAWAVGRGVFSTSGSSTIAHLTGEQLRRYRFPVPLVEEQQEIVVCLDRETAKVDALVGEQRRLIGLLREKRQAIISQAVTKGLHADVPMKDSGVEWLGSVPRHWDVKPVKRVIVSIEQGWSPQCEVYPASDDEWGVLKVGCVNYGRFNPCENKALPEGQEPVAGLELLKSDVLISRANTRQLVGSVAMVDCDYPRLLLCDKLYRLRAVPSLCLPGYLAVALAAESARGEIEISATGASDSMLNIAQSTVLNLAIALPPVSEQAEILTAIDGETAKLDALIAEAERAISLLQERRTALISAAVTGKIDVRGMATGAAV